MYQAVLPCPMYTLLPCPRYILLPCSEYLLLLLLVNVLDHFWTIFDRFTLA